MGMKTSIHARLSKEDRAVLEELKKATGCSESELIRRGLRLVFQELKQKPSALALAGTSTGKFTGGAKDLSRNAKHLQEFGR